MDEGFNFDSNLIKLRAKLNSDFAPKKPTFEVGSFGELLSGFMVR